MYVTTRLEQGVRVRRADRQAALGLRSEGAAASRRCNACCDVVNRGVAVWKGKVYRRHARRPADRARRRDRQAGLGACRPSTRRKPLHDHRRAARRRRARCSSATAAPSIGVRGYVTAYDADDRQAGLALLHRARRSGEAGFENAVAGDGREDLDTASGGSSAAAARCGTRSPTIPSSTCSTSAPATARPWNQQLRSPGGRRQPVPVLDRRAEAGHRRVRLALPDDARRDAGTTPPRSTIILADLTIDGAPRKVLMQAPKNGFFYVLDRATGELHLGEALSSTSTGPPAST